MHITKKEEGYIFGLFEGDGYKTHDKKSRHYHVEFYLNSKKDIKIIDFIALLLRKLKLNPNIYQDKRYNCKRIRVYSKDFFNYISKNINLSKENKEFKIGYISGIIDSEGYVNNKKSYIMVVNTNKKMLNYCKKFLNSLKIKCDVLLVLKDCPAGQLFASQKARLPTMSTLLSSKLFHDVHLDYAHSY